MRKNGSASAKFQTTSEDFDSGYGHDSNRNSIYMWHCNQQDRLIIKVSGFKEKIQMFQLYNRIFPIVVRYYEQKYL